jgi:hypothetical protein
MAQPLYKQLQRIKYRDHFFLQFANTFYPILAFLHQEYGIGLLFGMAETFDLLYNNDKKVQDKLKETINNQWHSAPYYRLFGAQRSTVPLLYKFINVAVELYIDGNRMENFPAIGGNYKTNRDIHHITALTDMVYQIDTQGPIHYLPVFSVVNDHIRFTENTNCQQEYKAQFWLMRSSGFPTLADKYINFLDTCNLADTPDRMILEMSLTCYYRRYCAERSNAGIAAKIIRLFAR